MGGAVNNYKRHIQNSEKGFLYSFNFVQLKQETHNPSKNAAYFIISDLFQDIVQITNSCFWKMKANCASAGLMSFLVDKVTAIYLALHTDCPPG